ncbi:hypothetical protein [Acanthopleuribacter pedis]|uniref:Uncharacterized protein n=1 Tax=Acanthopleuribacter pedis TaxID=442870 RepID=A0A8J7QLQ0_9BACT|nr:hypothetical protein [Acanthopleuribacter pedis]MBO1320618.1 hypothetical protein [Acanthopleuribacter pedis]
MQLYPRRGVILAYTCLMLLLITQIFFTGMALCRLYQQAFPNPHQDLHQMAWDHHLPLIEMAHYNQHLNPLIEQAQTQQLQINDEQFRGTYHLTGTPHFQTGVLNYEAASPHQIPGRYQALLLQNSDQVWHFRHIVFQPRN